MSDMVIDAVRRLNSEGREVWFTNPPKGKVPPQLRKFLFKKGHRPTNPGKRGGKSAPGWFDLHYPRRDRATVLFRDASGVFTKHAGQSGKSRPKNPAELAILNAYRGKKHGGKHPHRNPGGFLAKVKGAFSGVMPALPVAGGAIVGAVVNRQLIPRALDKFLPATGILSNVRTGIWNFVARALLVLLPPVAVALLVKSPMVRRLAVGYALGGVASVGASAIEAVMTKAGVPVLVGDYEVPGNPMGLFSLPRSAGGLGLFALSSPPLSEAEAVEGDYPTVEAGDEDDGQDY